MSNELAIISGIELGLDEDTLAVAGNAVKGNKRISIEGRVFRKIVGGKEQSVNTDNSMQVVFVKMAVKEAVLLLLLMVYRWEIPSTLIM